MPGSVDKSTIRRFVRKVAISQRVRHTGESGIQCQLRACRSDSGLRRNHAYPKAASARKIRRTLL